MMMWWPECVEKESPHPGPVPSPPPLAPSSSLPQQQFHNHYHCSQGHSAINSLSSLVSYPVNDMAASRYPPLESRSSGTTAHRRLQEALCAGRSKEKQNRDVGNEISEAGLQQVRTLLAERRQAATPSCNSSTSRLTAERVMAKELQRCYRRGSDGSGTTNGGVPPPSRSRAGTSRRSSATSSPAQRLRGGGGGVDGKQEQQWKRCKTNSQPPSLSRADLSDAIHTSEMATPHPVAARGSPCSSSRKAAPGHKLAKAMVAVAEEMAQHDLSRRSASSGRLKSVGGRGVGDGHRCRPSSTSRVGVSIGGGSGTHLEWCDGGAVTCCGPPLSPSDTTWRTPNSSSLHTSTAFTAPSLSFLYAVTGNHDQPSAVDYDAATERKTAVAAPLPSWWPSPSTPPHPPTHSSRPTSSATSHQQIKGSISKASTRGGRPPRLSPSRLTEAFYGSFQSEVLAKDAYLFFLGQQQHQGRPATGRAHRHTASTSATARHRETKKRSLPFSTSPSLVHETSRTASAAPPPRCFSVASTPTSANSSSPPLLPTTPTIPSHHWVPHQPSTKQRLVVANSSSSSQLRGNDSPPLALKKTAAFCRVVSLDTGVEEVSQRNEAPRSTTTASCRVRELLEQSRAIYLEAQRSNEGRVAPEQ